MQILILPKALFSYRNTKRATTDFISIYCDSLTIQSDFIYSPTFPLFKPSLLSLSSGSQSNTFLI